MCIRDRDITARIDRIGLFAALPDLQMPVVAGRVAGRANVADQLALLDILDCAGGDRPHVAVQGAVGIAVRHAAVIDDDVVAIAAAGPACHLHIATGGCVDGGTARRSQIS